MHNFEPYIPLISFSSTFPEEAQLLGEFSASLKNKSELLPISLFPNAKVQIVGEDNNCIKFRLPENFKFFYAYHYTSINCADKNDPKAWEIFFKTHLVGNNKKLLDVLGYGFDDLFYFIAHKIYKVDVLAILNTAEGHFKRLLNNSVVELLPFLEYDESQLSDAIINATPNITAEGNYFNVNNSVRETSIKNPAFGWCLLEKCDDDRKRKLFIPHIYLGITQNLGYAKTGSILSGLFSSKNINDVKIGLWCLRVLAGNEIASKNKDDILRKVSGVLELNAGELTGEVLYTLGLFIHSIPEAKHKIDEIIHDDISTEKAIAVASILWVNSKEISNDPWLLDLLFKINNLHAYPPNIYYNVSMSLLEVVKINPDFVFTFISNFLAYQETDPRNIEGFKNLFSELSQTNLVLFQKWITLWLNNDNPNFHVAVSKIISNFSGDNELRFELDKEVINSLTTPDVEFILYKLLGYFYPKEQLESLTFSITNFIGSGSISIANLYLDGYCNFILYNYPSSIKYLREKKQGATDLQLQVINAVEQFNEASDKNRKAKPKELSHSPERLQILFNQTNQGLNLENQKSKFKEASFLDMVKKVDLKTGDAFFTRGETGLQTLLNFKNRSRMSIVSANFEMPIGVITDPTGMEYRKFLWRIFKRSKR